MQKSDVKYAKYYDIWLHCYLCSEHIVILFMQNEGSLVQSSGRITLFRGSQTGASQHPSQESPVIATFATANQMWVMTTFLAALQCKESHSDPGESLKTFCPWLRCNHGDCIATVAPPLHTLTAKGPNSTREFGNCCHNSYIILCKIAQYILAGGNIYHNSDRTHRNRQSPSKFRTNNSYPRMCALLQIYTYGKNTYCRNRQWEPLLPMHECASFKKKVSPCCKKKYFIHRTYFPMSCVVM